MILNGSILGSSFLFNQFLIPQPTSYDSVKINGNCKIDKVRVLDIELSETEINNIKLNDIYTWNPNTLIYSEFGNNLSAGNITGISGAITNWDIYRKIKDESIYTKLKTINVSEKKYIDYTVKANKTYQYRIYAKNASEISDALNTGEVLTDFYTWSLCDENTGEVWLFELNLQSGDIKSNVDINIFDKAYTKYPSVSFSEKDYLSGSINCLAGTINADGTLYYPDDYLDNLRAFINNKKSKLLKNRRGDCWRVCTNNFNFKYEDFIPQQVANVTFDYVEVGVI
jgi:hypothetical protein